MVENITFLDVSVSFVSIYWVSVYRDFGEENEIFVHRMRADIEDFEEWRAPTCGCKPRFV